LPSRVKSEMSGNMDCGSTFRKICLTDKKTYRWRRRCLSTPPISVVDPNPNSKESAVLAESEYEKKFGFRSRYYKIKIIPKNLRSNI
jgi:hypothetical protein